MRSAKQILLIVAVVTCQACGSQPEGTPQGSSWLAPQIPSAASAATTSEASGVPATVPPLPETVDDGDSLPLPTGYAIAGILESQSVCCSAGLEVFEAADGNRVRVSTGTVDGEVPSEQTNIDAPVETDQSNATQTMWLGDRVVVVSLFALVGDPVTQLRDLDLASLTSSDGITSRLAEAGYRRIDSSEDQARSAADRSGLTIQLTQADRRLRLYSERVPANATADVLAGAVNEPTLAVDGLVAVSRVATPYSSASVSWVDAGWFHVLSWDDASDGRSQLELFSGAPRVPLEAVRGEATQKLGSQPIIDDGAQGDLTVSVRQPFSPSELPILCAQRREQLSCAQAVVPPAFGSLLVDGSWLLVGYDADGDMKFVGAEGFARLDVHRGAIWVAQVGSAGSVTVQVTDSVLGTREVTFNRPLL